MTQGQRLIHFDLEKIKQAGYDTTVIFLLTNQEDYKLQIYNLFKKVKTSEQVLSLALN